MYRNLSEDELEEIYSQLLPAQKDVLDNHVKRGMQTQWLNRMAKHIGQAIPEEDLHNPEAAMDKYLEWKLIEYIDAGHVDPNLRCECGRPLRRQFTVLKTATGEVIRFGITHFEQETGLDPKTVREVTTGLKSIDKERDEILWKVSIGWEIPDIPDTIQVPADIQIQLDVGLPLLERQMEKLRRLIRDDYLRRLAEDRNKLIAQKRAEVNSRKIDFPQLHHNLMARLGIRNKQFIALKELIEHNGITDLNAVWEIAKTCYSVDELMIKLQNG